MLSNPKQNENHVIAAAARSLLVSAIAASFPCSRWGTGPIGVAVSGGADSVALAATLTEYAKSEALDLSRIHLCHVNHHQRAEESDQDETHVRNLADSLGVKVVVCHDRSVEPGAAGAEAELRSIRYRFFQHWAERVGARCIATAHHLSDDAETILFRIFRGTSINGLQGIPFTRSISESVTVVRPFLNVRRDEIIRYLELNDISYRHDSSNESSRFSRNWIRNELIPLLEKEFGTGVQDRISLLAANASETMKALDDAAESMFSTRILRQDKDFILIDALPLASASTPLLKHWLVNLWTTKQWRLRDMNREKWEALAGFIQSTSSSPKRIELPASVVTRFENGIVRIEHRPSSKDGNQQSTTKR